MNKSAQIKAIYHELRSVVGSRASTQEILQCANSLVELFSIDEGTPRCDMWTGGISFENWSLDVAIADGGWRIFWYEFHSGNEVVSDEWEGVPADLLEGRINLEELTCQM